MVGGRTSLRRDELVDAAFRRVAEVGFEGLRLRQVAEDVGIDHSTLHHHIATKRELVEAVTAHTIRQLVDTAPEQADPADGLRAHLAMLRRLMVERPELFTVTAELDLRARRDPEMAAMLADFESGWRAALVDRIACGGTRVPPEPAAELVIAAVKGVRLAPDLAGTVFAQLEALLLGAPDPERSKP